MNQESSQSVFPCNLMNNMLILFFARLVHQCGSLPNVVLQTLVRSAYLDILLFASFQSNRSLDTYVFRQNGSTSIELSSDKCTFLPRNCRRSTKAIVRAVSWCRPAREPDLEFAQPACQPGDSKDKPLGADSLQGSANSGIGQRTSAHRPYRAIEGLGSMIQSNLSYKS